jgi:SET domain-containing protein
VIDGSRGGNSARWLNHACEPTCETIEDEGRIFIHTLRAIEPDEELFVEYLLSIDDSANEEARARYACRCTASGCCQSMLAGAA